MNYEESKLQRQCVAWFRAQYPQYAMLLTHPANEGNGNRVSGAIHKAEGTMAGVPDLILFLPVLAASLGFDIEDRRELGYIHGLGIELKTAKGRQSQSQQDFQHIFEAAGYSYYIVRSFNEFRSIITNWISWADPETRKSIASAHVEIRQAEKERDLLRFKRIITNKTQKQ